MSLDFARIKEIPITQVVARYNVRLRFKGAWGSAQCPLPAHKDGDKDRNFSVNVEGNYWKCWSKSCNETAGKKGGDVINFVALMESCREKEAAEKLASWFGISEQQKGAPRMEARPSSNRPAKDSLENNTSDSGVKYTERVRIWFTELVKRHDGEDEEAYHKRMLRSITTQLIENYKLGKAGKIL